MGESWAIIFVALGGVKKCSFSRDNHRIGDDRINQMKNPKRIVITTLVITFLLAACNPAAAPTELPAPAVIDTVAVTPTPEATALPFEAATYTDAANGIQLLYPADWFVLGGETQSRGAYVHIASWDPGAGGLTEIPEGESVLQITIYQWDPQRDLAARVEMRRNNFIASGNTILEEETLMLGSVTAVRILLQNTDGSLSLVLFTELGEDYLELSGNGDIPTLDAAMRTLIISAEE